MNSEGEVMQNEWDEDGFEPDSGDEADIYDGQPEVETADEYGPVDTFTEAVEAPEDIPNGEAQ
jgi:hypothetical protein